MHFIKTLSLQNSEIKYSLIFNDIKYNFLIRLLCFRTKDTSFPILMFTDKCQGLKIIHDERKLSWGNCVEEVGEM